MNGSAHDASDVDNREWPPGYVCGDWRIERFVDRGGMGEVYEVRGTLGGKHGALKRILPELATRPGFEKRFVNEVEILAALRCEYIVQLLHAGKHEGRPYLVMEWLDGITLRDFLNQRREPMTLADALHIAECVAIALTEAHAEGIFHRDLKPENIFLIEKGTLKVLDFGLGKWAATGRVRTSEQAGGALCTVHYAAPEQLDRSAGGVDDRTDVRALALIFFEMVTLRWAFADKTGELPDREIARANQLFAEPHSLRTFLPHCPSSLSALIDRALRRDKAGRPHSNEFLAALRDELRALVGTGAAPVPADRTRAAAPASAPRTRTREESVVRVIPQLRTLTLPVDQPVGDPTAAGNPLPPLPPPTHTVPMVNRPAYAEIEAALRERSAREAQSAHAARAAAHAPVEETFQGSRAASLPPDPHAFQTHVPNPGSREPMMHGYEDAAASRASLEAASRPTLPFGRGQDVTPSPTASQRGGSLFGRVSVPTWTAPLLGMALTLAIFFVARAVRTPARMAAKPVLATALPTATASAHVVPATSATEAPLAALASSTTATPIVAPSATATPTVAPSATATPTVALSATAAPRTAVPATPAPAKKPPSAVTATPKPFAPEPPFDANRDGEPFRHTKPDEPNGRNPGRLF